jgi:Zn-dependent protease with chaperone function
MNELITTLLSESPIYGLIAMLVLPIVLTVWFRSRASRADELERPRKWIVYGQWLQVIYICTVAIWWSLWDFQRVHALTRTHFLSMKSFDPALATPILFLVLPFGSVAIARLIAAAASRTFYANKWTATDLVRLTFWGTASSTLVFLLVAIGFDAVYSRSWTGIFWVVAAGFLRVVGMSRYRRAEGIIFRRVKSGEVYKRAFSLARSMNVNLDRVHVVPIGRGHLTNAHGWPRSIAVTENYSKFLHGPELDFIIGHELSHGKELHGIKNLAVAPVVLCVLAPIYWLLPATLVSFRPILDIAVTLLPILIARFFSRRFEFAADAASVAFTKNPGAATQALVNLNSHIQAPAHRNEILELFATHPALNRRIEAIEAHDS